MCLVTSEQPKTRAKTAAFISATHPVVLPRGHTTRANEPQSLSGPPASPSRSRACQIAHRGGRWVLNKRKDVAATCSSESLGDLHSIEDEDGVAGTSQRLQWAWCCQPGLPSCSPLLPERGGGGAPRRAHTAPMCHGEKVFARCNLIGPSALDTQGVCLSKGKILIWSLANNAID